MRRGKKFYLKKLYINLLFFLIFFFSLAILVFYYPPDRNLIILFFAISFLTVFFLFSALTRYALALAELIAGLLVLRYFRMENYPNIALLVLVSVSLFFFQRER